MKISELINTLIMMKSLHGDLEVGINNKEFEGYDSIDSLERRRSDRVINKSPLFKDYFDDEKLGNEFIGINS